MLSRVPRVLSRWSLVTVLIAAPVLCSAALLFSAGLAYAETPAEQTKRAQQINRTTMSPFCPGRTLSGCSSGYAADWREDVRRWVAAGVSTEEIRLRLEKRAPDKDLTGAPSTVLDSILPGIVTVFAIVALVLLLRLLVKPQKEVVAKPKQSELSDVELDERLERELAGLDD